MNQTEENNEGEFYDYPTRTYEINFMDGTKILFEIDLGEALAEDMKEWIEDKRGVPASALEIFEAGIEDAIEDNKPITNLVLYCLINPPLKFKEGETITGDRTDFIIKEVLDKHIIVDIRNRDNDAFDEDNIKIPFTYSQMEYMDYFDYEVHQDADPNYFEDGTYTQDIKMYADGDYSVC